MASADLRAARRYAAALFAAAQQDGKRDAIEKDLDGIHDLMVQTPPFRQAWESPLLPGARKGELIESLLGKSLDPVTLSFLRLLIDKRREEILDGVREEYHRMADVSRNLVRAEATFAVQPTPTEVDSLRRSLAQRTGANVELAVEVDPAILGGVIVRMSDTILDGSVRGTLESLRERLLQEA